MFIKNKSYFTVGDKVKINRDVDVLAGTFTAGHEFTVVSMGARGPDLKDSDGNVLGEMGLNMDAIERID